jgi:hypothetical protein
MGVPHAVMGGVQYRKTEEGSNINSSEGGSMWEVALDCKDRMGFVLRACARGEQMSLREGERLFEGG